MNIIIYLTVNNLYIWYVYLTHFQFRYDNLRGITTKYY